MAVDTMYGKLRPFIIIAMYFWGIADTFLVAIQPPPGKATPWIHFVRTCRCTVVVAWLSNKVKEIRYLCSICCSLNKIITKAFAMGLGWRLQDRSPQRTYNLTSFILHADDPIPILYVMPSRKFTARTRKFLGGLWWGNETKKFLVSALWASAGKR